jgi:hypothetical protein
MMTALILGGCFTYSTINTNDGTEDEFSDVFLMTIMARDYFRNTNGRAFNLQELAKCDSLDRITKNFESVNTTMRWGHMAIQYKFSKARDRNIQLTDKERQMAEVFKVYKNGNADGNDGEIQFEFGEYYFNVIKIISARP